MTWIIVHKAGSSAEYALNTNHVKAMCRSKSLVGIDGEVTLVAFDLTLEPPKDGKVAATVFKDHLEIKETPREIIAMIKAEEVPKKFHQSDFSLEEINQAQDMVNGSKQ